MDHVDHGNMSGSPLRIARRVFSLSKPATQKFRTTYQNHLQNHARKFLSLAFLVVSIGVGILANSISQSEAVRSWLKTHLPSSQLIEFVAKHHGFQPCREPHSLQKAMRLIPTRLDDEGNFWLSDDRNWIAVFGEPQSTFQAHLYCFQCSVFPKRWELLGTGWEAFESLIQILSKKRHSIRVQPKMRTSYRDPRAIQY